MDRRPSYSLWLAAMLLVSALAFSIWVSAANDVRMYDLYGQAWICDYYSKQTGIDCYQEGTGARSFLVYSWALWPEFLPEGARFTAGAQPGQN